MRNMQVQFLGTGNAFHSDSRANTGILIRAAGFIWCVEAGPSLLFQLGKYAIPPTAIENLFITHFHGDHAAGIPFFMLHLYEFTQNNYSLTINGPAGIKACCRRYYEAAYPGIPLDTHAHYREFPIAPGTHFLDRGGVLETFPMQHNPESLGYRFTLNGKRIAVTGDTQWNANILPLVQGCDLAIMECTTLERTHYTHTSFEEFAENWEALGAKLIVPVHLTNEIAAAFKKLNCPGIKVVEDGESIEL